MVVPGGWHEPHGQAGVVPGWEKTKVTYTLVLFPPNSRQASSGRFIFALLTLNQNMGGGGGSWGRNPKKPKYPNTPGISRSVSFDCQKKVWWLGRGGKRGVSGLPLAAKSDA